MSKLNNYTSYQAQSRKHGKRLYTRLDMAIVKHDMAVRNARLKRGEGVSKSIHYISECGCGVEGCFIHGSYDKH